MTINYTTNLSLAEPVTGTESGTWGDDVNKGLTDYLDISIAGTLALTSASFTANALTLANTTGSSSSNGIVATTAQYYVLKVSSLAANVTITAPSSSKSYIVVNNDPTYTVTIKASGQTGVTVAVSSRALVVFNGTDYAQVGASAGGSNTQVQYNSSGALAGSANHTFDGTTMTLGNAGVSARFQGDFSNATFSTRTAFQTGTTNATTGIYALPNGTSTAASWQATNNSDPTNASKILIATNGSTDVQLVSGINGTGTYLPLSFYTNGAQKGQINLAGDYTAVGNVVAQGGLHLNAQTISTSYSIPSGYSASSAGPITLSTGVSVTVPSGSRWVVL